MWNRWRHFMDHSIPQIWIESSYPPIGCDVKWTRI
ncbi:unnamed protein product [Larinioides sclopetarius]|uniref:Uncharacterized protein n=1 Tax=Larinioides sclopetarius TaxID=280406 RepID=A0AAV1ZEU1_9ARAC